MPKAGIYKKFAFIKIASHMLVKESLYDAYMVLSLLEKLSSYY